MTLVLRLDEDAERLGREGEKRLVVEFRRALSLVLTLAQRLDALANLLRKLSRDLFLPLVAHLHRSDDLLLLLDGNIKAAIANYLAIVLSVPPIVLRKRRIDLLGLVSFLHDTVALRKDLVSGGAPVRAQSRIALPQNG